HQIATPKCPRWPGRDASIPDQKANSSLPQAIGLSRDRPFGKGRLDRVGARRVAQNGRASHPPGLPPHARSGSVSSADGKACDDLWMVTCSECGFDYDNHPPVAVVSELASLGGRYRSELAPSLEAGGLLTKRPSEGVWSPLEYACHVRDLLLAQRE